MSHSLSAMHVLTGEKIFYFTLHIFKHEIHCEKLKSARHCVFYGVESWIGVLDWSHGVEYWSGLLEWNLEVKCWSVRETFILVVKLVSFDWTL